MNQQELKQKLNEAIDKIYGPDKWDDKIKQFRLRQKQLQKKEKAKAKDQIAKQKFEREELLKRSRQKIEEWQVSN
jgi:hypothetical protein